jgi:hypothetical protein
MRVCRTASNRFLRNGAFLLRQSGSSLLFFCAPYPPVPRYLDPSKPFRHSTNQPTNPSHPFEWSTMAWPILTMATWALSTEQRRFAGTLWCDCPTARADDLAVWLFARAAGIGDMGQATSCWPAASLVTRWRPVCILSFFFFFPLLLVIMAVLFGVIIAGGSVYYSSLPKLLTSRRVRPATTAQSGRPFN